MARLSLPRSTALLAGCVMSCACATTRYTQSRIEAVPPEAKGRTGSRASVAIEGVRVRIEGLDRAPRGREIPRLVLRLEFDPRELGYSFDPGQAILRDAQGREWRAGGGGYQPLYPGARVDLCFDVVVPPEAQAELVLGGLAHGRRPLAPVTLRVGRHAGRSYDRLYWLEAIGYALALPLAAASGGW